MKIKRNHHHFSKVLEGSSIWGSGQENPIGSIGYVNPINWEKERLANDKYNKVYELNYIYLDIALSIYLNHSLRILIYTQTVLSSYVNILKK